MNDSRDFFKKNREGFPRTCQFHSFNLSFRLTQQWQNRLSELGFDSAIAQLGANNDTNEQGNELLQSWFKGLCFFLLSCDIYLARTKIFKVVCYFMSLIIYILCIYL